MAERTFSAGEMIFEAGDPSEVAYIIESGHVEIIKAYPEALVVLAHLEAGDIFGEMGLVDERPRSLTARAVDRVRVTTVTRSEFVDMLVHQPRESIGYVRTLFDRLRAMNAQIGVQHGQGTAGAGALASAMVTILPLTRKARQAVPRRGITITRFPYRVGRDSSSNENPNPLDMNDLYLSDTSPFNVSRHHFSIDRTETGIVVTDRGSYIGTIVNGEAIGGHRRVAQAELAPGDNEIIAGGPHSPFRFRVVVVPKS